MTRCWLVLVALVACGRSERAASPLPPRAPAGASAPAPAAEVEKFTVVSRGNRKSGYLSRTRAADGSYRLVYHVLQNGRGPHVEATLRLAKDGTVAAWSAHGKHTMGTKVAETFTRDGDRVRWKSEEEHGERTVSGPAFFLPIADMPMSGFLASAALQHGGTIALLPAGEAHVESASELEVRDAAGSAKRRLVGYRVTGVELDPVYTWFDAKGGWFGTVGTWESVLPEGWEHVNDVLLAHQRELARSRSAKLAEMHAHRPPRAGLALTNARVLDVRRGKWLDKHTVLVVGDKITAVGAKVAIPNGAEVIDLAGKAVIPGLVDMHSHLSPSDAVLNIAAGVTTVRDVGNDPDELDDMKQRFDDGTAIGPHVVRYGFIEGRNEKAAASRITAETVEEAKQAVAFFAKRGYEGVKIYNSVKTELVPVIAKAAHARGMLVTGHVPVHMLANEAIRAGYDGIEHINQLLLNFFATHDTDTRDTTRFTLVGEQAPDFDLNGKPAKEFFALLRQKKIVVDSTLVPFEDLYAGVPGKITPGLEDLVARLPMQTRRWFVMGGLPLDGERRALYARAWTKLFEVVKAMWDAKIHLVVGTDHINGIMLHHEMELFVRAGIPAADVMKIATIDGARALRMDKRFGTIAAGKRADLAILDGDPLADIKALRRIETTIRGGVVFRSAPLYEAVGVKP